MRAASARNPCGGISTRVGSPRRSASSQRSRRVRRDTDDPQQHLHAAAVERRRQQRAQRRLERKRRRPEQPCRGTCSSQSPRAISSRCAAPANTIGAESRRACKLPHQRKSGFARVLAVSGGRVRHHNDFGSRSGADASRRIEPGRELLDRAGLQDVERLALRDAACGDRSAGLRHTVARRELVRERSAERAAPNDRDERHRSRLFYWDDDGRPTTVTGGIASPAKARSRWSRWVEGHRPRDRARHSRSGAPRGDHRPRSAALDAARQDAPRRRAPRGVRADVRKAAEAERAVETAVTRSAVSNSGQQRRRRRLHERRRHVAVAEWHQIIETNLSGVFYCCHAAIPHLRRRGGGWIINISSLASKNAFAGGAAYCASKAGLNAFSEALMQEVRYDNIRVSCVMPGSVATGFGGRGEPREPTGSSQPEDVAQVVIDLLAHAATQPAEPGRAAPSRPRK